MAVSETRLMSAQRALIIAFFLNGFMAISWIPRIPELIDQIDVSFATWGLIIGLSGLGSLIPLLITNRLIGRFGTKPVARVANVMIVLCLIALSWAPNAAVFFLINALMSFSGSFFGIAVNAQSVMLQKQVKSTVIGRFHAAWSIGSALSAGVSGILASFLSLQLQLFIVPLISLLVFEYFARDMLKPTEDGHKEERARSHGGSFFKSPPQLWLLAFGFFSGVFPELMMMDWSAVFTQKTLSLHPTIGTIPFTVFTIAMIVSRLSITRLTSRFHISELSKWGGVYGSIAMLLGVLLAPALTAQNQILGLVVLSVFWGLAGLGCGPMVPSFFSAAGHIDGLATAQALSRMSLVNALLVMVAKISMGALAQGVGLQLAFLFPVVMMFLAGMIAAQVAKRAKRREAMDNAFPPTGPLSIIDEL